jgi:hypothetical protein
MRVSVRNLTIVSVSTIIFLRAGTGLANDSGEYESGECDYVTNIVARCEFLPVEELESDAPAGIATVKKISWYHSQQANKSCPLDGVTWLNARVNWSSRDGSLLYAKGMSYNYSPVPSGTSFSVAGLKENSSWSFYVVTTSANFLLSNDNLPPQTMKLLIVSKQFQEPHPITYRLTCPSPR